MDDDCDNVMAHPTDDWQTIRIPPAERLGRSRGFPKQWIAPERMMAWCTQNCAKWWTGEIEPAGDAVFRFEDPADAIAFALRWFPYQCT
jgi:hypothetical protein